MIRVETQLLKLGQFGMAVLVFIGALANSFERFIVEFSLGEGDIWVLIAATIGLAASYILIFSYGNLPAPRYYGDKSLDRMNTVIQAIFLLFTCFFLLALIFVPPVVFVLTISYEARISQVVSVVCLAVDVILYLFLMIELAQRI